MDFKGRIIIPKDFLAASRTDFSVPVALCLEDDKIFYLWNFKELPDEALVVAAVSVSKNGRFHFPAHVLRYYNISETAQPFVTIHNRKIYICFDYE